MAFRHNIGKLGESLAERFLTERGYTLIERNARVGGDELDLIMTLGPTIVAVEVKTTTNGANPFDAADSDKMFRVSRGADAYRLRISRIDVIGVMISERGATIHWVKAME